MAGAKKKQERKKQRENAKKKINNDKDQESETDENENSFFPMTERSEKAKIMQAKVGGKFAARDKFALSVASMRGEHYKRKRKEISNLKKYRLEKDADATALKKLQEDRWYEFWKARSVEVVKGSVATPPMSANFYHMIEIMENEVSVLQLLFELHDGYYVGFRPTPPDPYAKGGFYIFSNVKLPDFFGASFKIDRSSDYQATHQVMIGLNFLGTMTDELSSVNPKSVNGVSGGIMETPMIVFGEGIRMREFEDFIAENYEGDLVQLAGRLSIFYGNWSCLSKFEESVIKKLIIRSQHFKSSFVDVDRKTNEEDSELDSDSKDDEAAEDDEEADAGCDQDDEELKKEYRRMANREYHRWELILADEDKDLLVELLRL